MTHVGRDQGDFTGMIVASKRIPIMTLLKILVTAMVAVAFMLIASPGFAANDGDGVAGGTPNAPADPAAKQRRHRKHKLHRHHRRHPQPTAPSDSPA